MTATLLTLILLPGQAQRPAASAPLTISLDGFRSGAHHWRNIRDTSRFIQVTPHQPAYPPTDIESIAANILLFQRTNGGWPKDYDMAAVLTDDQRAQVIATRNKTDTSYDNNNIHAQVEYLARAYALKGHLSWKQSCERGIDFILSSQYANGGFPQRFPKPTGYAAHITFNDGVMVGVLNLLQDVSEGASHVTWVDSDRRQKATQAVERGIACILRCQIFADGKLTGWCQQHDKSTYEPRPARTFELASICPQETTSIVRFLMRQPRPSPKIIASTDAAVDWLRLAQLSGVRTEKVPAGKEEFLRQSADFDVVLKRVPGAPPLWARHYEIGTNRPIFAGRDGIQKDSLAEIERERRTGTPWYGAWPTKLVAGDYERWRKKLATP